MGYSTESRAYIVQAVDVLKRGHAADDCGACRGMVAEEITHLEELVVLTDGVRDYVDKQAGTTRVLTQGVQRVRTALGDPPAPTTAPAGPERSRMGILGGILSDRPRLMDLIDLGR